MSRLEGADKLREMLGSLGDKFARDSVRKALRAGAKVQLAALVEAAPVDSGKLRGALKVRAMKRSRVGIGMMVSLSKAFLTGATFYAGFVNWGWIWARHARAHVRTRVKGKTNNTTSQTVAKGEKKIPGTEWMEKAWESAADATVTEVKAVLRTEFEKQVEAMKK